MTTTTKPDDDHKTDEKTDWVKKIKGGKFAWLLYLVIGLIIFFGILSLIARTKNKSNEKTKNESEKSTVIVAERVESIPVTISKKRTKVNIPYGVRSIHFRNATIPYCAENAGREKHCSNDTEDIIGLFTEGYSTDNLTYWIESQSAEGSIVVELTYFVQ